MIATRPHTRANTFFFTVLVAFTASTIVIESVHRHLHHPYLHPWLWDTRMKHDKATVRRVYARELRWVSLQPPQSLCVPAMQPASLCVSALHKTRARSHRKQKGRAVSHFAITVKQFVATRSDFAP
ncbi:hypothetical protein BJV78DRAFT_930800 [Lactifluus subvellereus]|nr:hypothetical protein BJV78DRAFT_930800 [Lactifluus subvellereus]